MLETVSKLTNACASSLTISLTSLTITQAGLHRGREYLFHHGKQLCETTREGALSTEPLSSILKESNYDKNHICLLDKLEFSRIFKTVCYLIT